MKYVHQCILASEKATKKRDEVPRPPASQETSLQETSLQETSLRQKTSPKKAETTTELNSEALELSTSPTLTRPSSNAEKDRPIRSLDALPATSVTDANQGREGTAPMMEDWRWTVRMVEHGYRLGEIALVRGKTPDAILEDLTRALNGGCRFAIDNLFDRRTQIALKELKESDSRSNTPPSGLQSYPSLWNFVQRWLEQSNRSR
jgi:hypothetical protein